MEEDGTVAASYKYDAWGNIMAQGGFNSTLASLNPFRYRGYVYDEETGLYYLQNRYYDPQVGRFINADGYLTTGQGFTGNNCFAYCGNNPVNSFDPEGHFLHIIAGAFLGGLIGFAVSAISQYVNTGNVNIGIVAVNAISGAISGAVATTGIGLVASVGVNAALGAATYSAEQAIKGEKIEAVGLAASTFSGAISGFIGGKGANVKPLVNNLKAATKSVEKEIRRQSFKYSAKVIAKEMIVKKSIKVNIGIAVGSFTIGQVSADFARRKFGY